MAENTSRKKWAIRLGLFIAVILLLGIGSMLGGKRPDNLGVKNGQLASCPDKPNCVSTQAPDEAHRIEPYKIVGDKMKVADKIRETLSGWPRTKVVTDDNGYFYAECTSAICRFVDDLEVWVDDENGLVHARSASRVGYSDLGVNRKRVEKLFAYLQ